MTDSDTAQPRGRFGAWDGVFVPTLLTILGVILFLRTGWVVGHTGLLGALLIVTLAFAISTATGLSLSSIVTNIRVEGGGAFSIITKTLGVELGGSIGIPLYLSQALVIVLYIFGFREGWRWIFPEHPALLVDLITCLILATIAWISARLAFRLQYVILILIALAIGTFFATLFASDTQNTPQFWPESGPSTLLSSSYWDAFAVFFPAVTGIMAGANMSGELRSPSRDIPRGTLWAIGVAYVIYIGSVVALAFLATPHQLQNNETLLIDLALWRPATLAGLLAATFSSALATMVGAPRILQSLARRQVIPAASWLSQLSRGGEPRRALLATTALVLVGIALRDLNVIASVITLFFLLTYGVINAVLLAEKLIGSASFRPTFTVPTLVPLIGLIGCLGGMVLIQPFFALASLLATMGLHAWMLRRDLDGPLGKVRSGFAMWASDKVVWALDKIHRRKQHLWRANCLIPCISPLPNPLCELVEAICNPQGSVILLGINADGEDPDALKTALHETQQRFRNGGIFAKQTTIAPENPVAGLELALQLLRAMPLRPNILLLPLSLIAQSEDEDAAPHIRSPLFTPQEDDQGLQRIVAHAHSLNFGLCLFTSPTEHTQPDNAHVHIWLERPGEAWEVPRNLEGFELTVLIAYALHQHLQLVPHFIACEDDPEARESALDGAHRLVQASRIPGATADATGPLLEAIEEHSTRLNLFVLRTLPTLQRLKRLVQTAQNPCLFVITSGDASVES